MKLAEASCRASIVIPDLPATESIGESGIRFFFFPDLRFRGNDKEKASFGINSQYDTQSLARKSSNHCWSSHYVVKTSLRGFVTLKIDLSNFEHQLVSYSRILFAQLKERVGVY